MVHSFVSGFIDHVTGVAMEAPMTKVNTMY